MEKIAVVVWEDRHTDTGVFLFSDLSVAIKWAKEKVKEYAHFPEDTKEELTDGMKQAGWKYYGRYSCEGDSIRVVEVVVDKDLEVIK